MSLNNYFISSNSGSLNAYSELRLKHFLLNSFVTVLKLKNVFLLNNLFANEDQINFRLRYRTRSALAMN